MTNKVKGSNTNPYYEMQLLSGLAEDPSLTTRYPDFDQYMTGERKSIAKAIKEIAGKTKEGEAAQPASIAAICSTNGWPRATAQDVADILAEGGKWGVNMPIAYEGLQSLYVMREFDVASSDIRDKVVIEGMDPLEAVENLRQTMMEKVGTRAIKGWEPAEWLVQFGSKWAEKQRQLVNDGKVFGWMKSWGKFNQSISRLGRGYIFLLAETSAGKTGGAMQLANYLAYMGDNVLFAMNEATKDEMMLRLLAYKTGYNYTDLQNGYWDEKCEKALMPFESGGKLEFVEASGIPYTSLLASAERRKAHLVVDVFSGTNIYSFGKQKGANEYSAMNAALEYGEGWCQKSCPEETRRLIIGTLQRSKAARVGGADISADDAIGTSAYRNKASVFIVVNSKKVTQKMTIPDPVTGVSVTVDPEDDCPILQGWLEKNRFGQKRGKTRQMLWMDGPRMRWVPLNDNKADQYELYMKEMTQAERSYGKGKSYGQ